MSISSDPPFAAHGGTGIAKFYLRVRQRTLALCDTLAPEDTVVQSMADVSPTKWHLAHTTWFFERFVLQNHVPAYREFQPIYDHLFNSYYYTVGDMFTRAERGLLSRPTLADILRYREHVDTQILSLIEHTDDTRELDVLITLGLNHEQQHQELLLTDIKHVFSVNPLQPVFREPAAWPTGNAGPLEFVAGAEGVIECGATGSNGFCFDNETPRHQVLVRPHALANRPITNGEYRDFIRDGAYEDCSLWLADGWSRLQQDGWRRPFYWSEDLQSEFTLNGQVDLDLNAPVCHLSLYEADAFARWAGKRLPTEFELELALDQAAVTGNLVEEDQFHPRAQRLPAPSLVDGNNEPPAATEHTQLYGDVWEWTASPYTPYPGFVPLAGSLGEYNGKFMCSQVVLRGGSCATPRSHIRSTYRNFFYPDARWQFSGVRLAHDA